MGEIVELTTVLIGQSTACSKGGCEARMEIESGDGDGEVPITPFTRLCTRYNFLTGHFETDARDDGRRRGREVSVAAFSRDLSVLWSPKRTRRTSDER
jgi:hypothetical protein